MAYFNYSDLRSRVRTALDKQGSDARKIVMLHSGVVIGVGLLLSILSYLLDMGIAETGGLSGMGARAMLETVQTVLETFNMMLIPFWTMGYTFTILSIARGEYADNRSLLWGFRHWGVVLRSLLLQGMIYFALAMVGAQMAGLLFMLTPGAQSLFALAEEMVATGMTDPYAMMDSPAYQQVVGQMLPYVLVGMLIFVVPLYYRLRFADFVLAEDPQVGALRAILTSFRMTRRKSLAIFKLDLHFWWFYLVQLLIVAIGYGDLLLALVNVELGISADAAMFVFYIAGLLCEFGLYAWMKNQVSGTYALAYDQLLHDAVEAPQFAQKNVPWDA